MAANLNILAAFFECAASGPERAAIIDKDGRRITFRELEQEVIETAAWFHAKGIRKGDRVLVFIPMGIDLYRSVLALFHIGAVAVFLDEWVSKERMELCCRIADCKALIAGWKVRLLGLFSKEIRRIPVKLGPRRSSAPPAVFDPTTEDDTALITFTTGSTGTPKAARRTHGFLKAQFDALVDKINPKTGEIDMPVLPIVLLLNLGTGVTSVIADFKATKPNELDEEKIFAQIRAHAVNRLTASPFFLRRLAEHAIRSGLTGLPLTRMFTGGAPVFPDEARLYTSAFPGCETTIVYGSTEAEPISSIVAGELAGQHLDLHSGLDVGPAYHGTAVRIIGITEDPLHFETDEALAAACLAPGTTGEIIVSGKHVLREYFNNDEALRRNKIFIGDTVWHRTGDAGFVDPNGHLRLCGRCSTMILKSDGSYYSPFLYENYFAQLNGVSTGTVLKSGNKTVAVIERKPGAAESGIRNALVAEGHGFDAILFVEKIPRDPRHHSKIDYGKLKGTLPAV